MRCAGGQPQDRPTRTMGDRTGRGVNYKRCVTCLLHASCHLSRTNLTHTHRVRVRAIGDSHLTDFRNTSTQAVGEALGDVCTPGEWASCPNEAIYSSKSVVLWKLSSMSTGNTLNRVFNRDCSRVRPCVCVCARWMCKGERKVGERKRES